MPNPLKEIIKDHIRKNGPMSVGAYMALALAHPEHGYYIKRDPFGRSKTDGGDFVTAPEVSQLFGEMIGVWAADAWMQMGSPDAFMLLECGPGRGTLMADALRATKNVSGFHAAMHLGLLEISPVLKQAQKKALAAYDPQWFANAAELPDDVPMIVIGNEFLDALPFQQFIGHQERLITLDEEGALSFNIDGKITERAPEREGFVCEIVQRLNAQGGAAVFIDYGHLKSGTGDTFQAIRGHEYVDIFDHIGDADLTSHVDFEALVRVANDVQVESMTQAAFLQSLGIEVRANMLRQNANAQQAKDLQSGLRRLISRDEMGELFKVMILRGKPSK